MSTSTTAKRTLAKKPAAKPQTAKKEPAAAPEPKSLLDALTTGQAVLLKVRANGTRRSLPYLAPGTPQRTQAEAVARMRGEGKTVETIAEELQVSIATARRFVTNLALAHAVEAGTHDAAWTKGTRDVVVHTVQAKKAKA